MKKIVLAFSLIGISSMLFVGCGGGGDKKVAFDDVKIEYKSEGKYDLSHYLVPAQNQISNYVENDYINELGKRSYKDPDEDSPSYSASRYEVNGTIIKEFDNDGSLDTIYEIKADRIINKTFDGNQTEEEIFVRFADDSDYIFKKRDHDDDLGQVELICKLTDHYDNKKINGNDFSDVIEMGCTIDSHDSGKVGGNDIEVIAEGTLKFLFAKGKGYISSVSDICKKTKTNGKVTKSTCVKEVEEITTIN